MIQNWCAPVSIRWYGPGEHCENPTPGDVLLVDRGDGIAWLIERGQWLESHLWRRDLQGFTWNNHCGLIRNDGVLGDMVSEMGFKGHELRPLATYVDRRYCVVNFGVTQELRNIVLASDARIHGLSYGYLQYPALVFNGITGSQIAFSYGQTFICSTHVASVSKNIYFTTGRPEDNMIPADISKIVGARM